MDNDEIPVGYSRVTDCLKFFTPFATLDPESSFYKNVIHAAERGKRVHAYCDAYAQGLFVEDCDPECKNYVVAFKLWFDEMVDNVILTERRVNSENYKLSGCVDLVCRLKGDEELTIVDIKTPAIASKTWQLQTAAYKLLLESENIVSINRRICLMLPKEGTQIRVMEYTDHSEDTELFLNVLKLYRFFGV